MVVVAERVVVVVREKVAGVVIIVCAESPGIFMSSAEWIPSYFIFMGITDPVEGVSNYWFPLSQPSCFRVQRVFSAFDVGANWVPPSNIDTKHVKFSLYSLCSLTFCPMAVGSLGLVFARKYRHVC